MTQRPIGFFLRTGCPGHRGSSPINLNGALLHRGWIARAAQEAILVKSCRDHLTCTSAASSDPWRPWGKPLSGAHEQCAARFGWVTDRKRLSLSKSASRNLMAQRPGRQSQQARGSAVWRAHVDPAAPDPDCLPDQPLRTENAQAWPASVTTTEAERLSFSGPLRFSLGDPAATFRLGGLKRRRTRPNQSCLESGDLFLLSGERPGSPRLSRRRSHQIRRFDADRWRRSDQPDAAAGGGDRIVVGCRLGLRGIGALTSTWAFSRVANGGASPTCRRNARTAEIRYAQWTPPIAFDHTRSSKSATCGDDGASFAPLFTRN